MGILYHDVLANRPVASSWGNLFVPTDGVYLQLDEGASWASWGPLCGQWTLPNDAQFSWVNQGACVLDASHGMINLMVGSSGAVNCHLRVKAAPSTPYAITATFTGLVLQAALGGYGLVFRESGSGKFVTLQTNNNYEMGVYRFTNPTTLSAAYTIRTTVASPFLCHLRIADDGANRISSYSFDGQNWHQLHSVGRTDFITADEVGFMVSSNYSHSITLWSWAEA